MLEINHLWFVHGQGEQALQDLTATFPPGLVHAVMGPNGSGKSTLLHLLAGLAQPQRGTVQLAGASPFARTSATLGQIALLPQLLSPDALDSNTYARLHGVLWPRFCMATYEDALGRLGVPGSRLQSTLSTGELRKARIAFTLATGARVLLLDEPADGLDIEAKSALRGLLAEAIDPQRTIVLATHDVREFDGLIDHVSILARQQLLLHIRTDVLGEALLFGSGHTPPAQALHAVPRAGGYAFVLPGDGRITRPDLELLYQAVVAAPEKFAALGACA